MSEEYYQQVNEYLQDIAVGDYYYHFKREMGSALETNAYRITGFATDTATSPEQLLVLYTPIYLKDKVSYLPKSTCASRPIHDFFAIMDRGEYQGPRFIKITDPEVTAYLGTLNSVLPANS